MASRPPLATKDTLDADQLSGSLNPDGTAALQAPSKPSNGVPVSSAGPPDPDTHAHDFAPPGTKPAVSSEDDTSDDAVEDYDNMRPDPDTLMLSGRKSMDLGYRPASSGLDGTSEEKAAKRGSLPGKRAGGVPVKLEKTDRKGRYVLTADEPEIKEILAHESAGTKPRMRMRDLVFTRQFTTFDRQNPSASESPFFGFFTLFWIGMVLLFIQFSMHNWREYGSILGTNQVMKLMFSHDVFLLGITDGVMCVTTAATFYLQKLVSAGWVNWARYGWVIQNLWQMLYLGTIIWWTYFRSWPWTHSIFITLHALVFLMKQHSYGFYNGYLSGVRRRRDLLERKLEQLRQTEPIQSAPTSPTSPRSSQQLSDLSTGADLANLTNKMDHSLSKRRPSLGPRTGTNLNAEKSDVASVAAAIETGHTINRDQLTTFESIVHAEIAQLTRELSGKDTTGLNAYPHNLTIPSFFEYICLPTLVYELEYPRQEHTNWWYVLEKTTATFGVLCVMMVISQAFIYPPVAKTVAMKASGMSLEQRWAEFPFIVSDMLFPLLIEQLLTWYLIWECILNVLAEITRFADRGFYGAWWNSVTWDQYARDWNRPVHAFLLRHVYHSSISTLKLSRNAATFVTFLLSALVHEMCMAVLFKKVRGYLFCMQLLQMPLVTLSRHPWMKGRVVLGNVIFWLGLFVGPSFLTSLYLVI